VSKRKRQLKKSYKERIKGKQRDFLKNAYRHENFKLEKETNNVFIERNPKATEKYKKILDKAHSTQKNKENRKPHERRHKYRECDLEF